MKRQLATWNPLCLHVPMIRTVKTQRLATLATGGLMLAISVMGGAKIEVIAGVNLPMLIKLAEVRSRLALPEAALAAQEAGRKYISVASALLQRAG